MAILLLATAAHIVRRAPLDTTVFGGTVVLILIDRRRPLLARSALEDRLAGANPRRSDVGAAVYGVVVGSLGRGSWPMMIAVAAPGVVAAAAVLVARPDRPSEGAEPDPAAGATGASGTRIWVTLLIVAALWELAAFVQQPSPTVDSPDHPVLSSIIDPLLASPWHRAVFVALWCAAGSRLVRTVVAAEAQRSPYGVGERSIDEERSRRTWRGGFR